jgi:hypothetical protein
LDQQDLDRLAQLVPLVLLVVLLDLKVQPEQLDPLRLLVEFVGHILVTIHNKILISQEQSRIFLPHFL